MSEDQFKEYFVKHLSVDDFKKHSSAIDLFANLAHRAVIMSMVTKDDKR